MIGQVVRKSEYATMRGCTPAYVSKLLKTGKLAAPAVTPDGRINVVEAARMLGEPVPQLQPVPRPLPQPARDAIQAQPSRDLADQASDDAPTSAYADARARREAANARVAELELAEREGRLIDGHAAMQAFEARTRGLRDRLLSVSHTLADELAGLDDPIAIRKRIRESLEAALIEAATGDDNAV